MEQGTRKPRKVIIGAAAIVSILASDRASAAERALLPVVVYVSNQAATGRAVLGKAEAQAERIFKDAGVRLLWLDLEVEAYRPGCGEFTIVVTLLSPTMVRQLSRQGTSDKALGSASRSAGRAFIFPDRIRDLAANTRTIAAEMTGRVMAHEIGHLLLQEGHSHSGIMAAGMETDPAASARFTVPQTRAIQAFLKSRAAASGQDAGCATRRAADERD